MLIRTTPTIPAREITDERLYLRRRDFMRTAAAAAVGGAIGGVWLPGDPLHAQEPLANVRKSPLSTTGEDLTPFDDIASYNNFFEFGTDKSDPKNNSGRFKPRPWTVKIDGEVGKPG